MDSAPPNEPEDGEDALGTPEDGADALASPEPTSSSGDTSSTNDSPAKPVGKAPKKSGGIKAVLRRFNIYLLLFVFVLFLAGLIIMIAYFQSKSASTSSTIKTQTLTQNTLNQVANSDTSVGSTQTVLSVQSSAVFAGKVLIRQDLEVAGNLQIGGTVGLTNLAVAGSTQLGMAQINKDLSVAGNTSLQGTTTIAKGLQVSGTGSFGGTISAPQVTTSSLQLNSDLTLTHHIITGGGTPDRTNGGGLGNGGTTSVSGTDTAGTVSVNIGNSPAAGCFATVSFTQKYNTTPHVLLTPVGPSAGGLDYYVTRTAATFSICDATTPPAGSSFSFDYFVIN